MNSSGYTLHIDESLRGRFLGIGGFIAGTADLPDLVQDWDRLKQLMGLSPRMELKWSLGKKEPTRKALKGTQWDSQAKRADAMVGLLVRRDLTLICDVLVDAREARGRDGFDHYRHGLKWVLDRFVNFLINDVGGPPGPHFVVVDDPPTVADVRDDELEEKWDFSWLKNRERIAAETYKQLYWDGFGYPLPSLAETGFYPSVLTAHASDNSCLQAADVTVGATTQFVRDNLSSATLKGKFRSLLTGTRPVQLVDQTADTCMPDLWRRFRGHSARRVIPWGFTVFPPETEGWPELQEKASNWY